MNPWIYDIIKNIDTASEAELHEAIDELEFLYDALNDIDRDIAEGLIAQLNHRLERLRNAT
jgi:ABC-type phosphate transport system auxiliary subunit